MLRRAAVLVLLALPSVGLSQQAAPRRSESPQPPSRYQRVTEIGFDGDLIEADPSSPDIEYVDASPTMRHSSLVRIREEFRDEALEAIPGF